MPITTALKNLTVDASLDNIGVLWEHTETVNGEVVSQTLERAAFTPDQADIWSETMVTKIGEQAVAALLEAQALNASTLEIRNRAELDFETMKRERDYLVERVALLESILYPPPQPPIIPE